MSLRTLSAPAFGLALGGDAVGNRGLRLDATGALATVTGDACIHQDLLLLLMTAPGERVMRLDFGCHLRRLLFQPNDDTLAGLAIHYVRQAVERFEPRVRIVELDAGPRAQDEAGVGGPHILAIRLDYEVRRSGRTGRVDLALDLGEGGGLAGSAR